MRLLTTKEKESPKYLNEGIISYILIVSNTLILKFQFFRFVSKYYK